MSMAGSETAPGLLLLSASGLPGIISTFGSAGLALLGLGLGVLLLLSASPGIGGSSAVTGLSEGVSSVSKSRSPCQKPLALQICTSGVSHPLSTPVLDVSKNRSIREQSGPVRMESITEVLRL